MVQTPNAAVGEALSGGPARVDDSVTLLLVSHDGAVWLPTVIEGVRAQTAPISQMIAVDTGSRDGSPDLIEERLAPVVSTPATAGFAAAVDVGLAEVRRSGSETTWVWLLHDDSTPAPDALEALLRAAAAHPHADVFGPKLREWPSLLRLLEVGVTISGTGRRETGLETGEYDQGQHDEVRTVLAVNTAGMLVRRSVLDRLGGFETQLPVFGTDVDFGWRAAAAGLHTVVVPDAVVFHAEAAHRGLRRTPLTGSRTHFQQRRSALFTLLANSRPWALTLQVPRLVIGTLVRMLGWVIVRDPARALDEGAALCSVLGRPGTVRKSRRRRAAARSADPGDVRRLLAPAWMPYRHGLDLLADLGAALTQQAGDVAERRRGAAAGADPSSFAARRVEADAASAESAGEDTGIVARFATNPVAVLLGLVVLLVLVGSRQAIGNVSGGGLSPAPSSVRDWWDLLVQSRHPLAQGTSVPAPAYLLPLALLGTLLGGSAAAAVSLPLVACVPLALWGTWRFLRVLGRLVSLRGMPRWLILWGATTYALTPVVSGAWGDGRLGPVVAATLLPWLGHATLGFADPEADRRWRAAWRTGLLGALVAAFAPLVAVIVALLVGLVLVIGLVAAPSGVRQWSVWGPLATGAVVPFVLLAPWWIWSVAYGAAEGLVLDIGRLPQAGVGSLDLLAGRLDGLGAPLWSGLVLAGLAVVSLTPRRSRVGVIICWSVAALTLVLAAVLASVSLELVAASTVPGLSITPVVVQATFVIAVALAAQSLTGDGLRWRARSVRASLGTLAIGAALVPLAGLGWFLTDSGERLQDDGDDGIPAYMVQSSQLGPAHGILVVRGTEAEGLSYTVRRGDGITVGEDEIVALSGEDRAFTAQVRELAARPTPSVVDTLASNGIEYVVLPAPADADVAAALDATTGLVQASAEDRRTRAWQVDRTLDDAGVSAQRSLLHTLVLVVQLLSLLTVLVLCAPTRRRRS